MSDNNLAALVRAAAHRMEVAGLHFGHGTDNALDEACWMAAHVLRLAPDFPPETFDQAVDAAERSRFERLLAERITTRKPLAYLIGEAWFAGLKFRVDASVLVPRSPLAEPIVAGFEPWLAEDRLRRAADVGTGSGCIAIALAHHHRQLRVDALDVSPAALAIAECNVRDHGLAERVRLQQSDLLEAVAGQRYDLIMANPPYVPESSMAELPAEYAWEPALGLVAGSDGLDLVRRLIVQAAACLAPHGVLICEVGEAAAALDAWLADEPVTWLEFAHGGDGVFLLDRDGCRRVAARR
ncbi:50S ribosomal protein L3 N(5)-glutamine methyltransferase [Wenzhouxiangella limi]|uniref:50S ribosomal protein L3 N(5)-glutamine methyltransferase n=1 Tax=Wenzhouxiangella limi TaxID=2707351 RepID=A0A845V5A8_9GAMM|nr:50S ribosomal protein L3 N(5)-glutamine methyltransferase [Wenzhouxiangella limi]NDY96366.1 50S ribosomal protein L3 N(5)-glutamine methyltransferase [Wenzhouxiangella limi]